jgi:hypothetical protein
VSSLSVTGWCLRGLVSSLSRGLVSIGGFLSSKKIINCKLVLAEEHKEICSVVFSRIGFPHKNNGVLCFLLLFFFMHVLVIK